MYIKNNHYAKFQSFRGIQEQCTELYFCSKKVWTFDQLWLQFCPFPLGLEGHHLYREKESGMMYNTIDTRPSASQRREHQAHAANLKSQFDTFPRHHQHSALTITTTTTTTNLGGSSTLGSNEAETSLGRSVVASVHQLQQQLSTFKPPQVKVVNESFF